MGGSKVVSILIVVLLPAPLGPSRPKDLAALDRERHCIHCSSVVKTAGEPISFENDGNSPAVWGCYCEPFYCQQRGASIVAVPYRGFPLPPKGRCRYPLKVEIKTGRTWAECE